MTMSDRRSTKPAAGAAPRRRRRQLRSGGDGAGPTTADLEAWLAASGQPWSVTSRTVSATTWSAPRARAQYLCQRAALGLSYLHDEALAAGGHRVYFGVAN